MKKNRDSSELAARIAAAASQPAGRSAAPAHAPVAAPVLVSPAPAAKAPATTAAAAPAAAPARMKANKTKPAEQDTVPITLRPRTALLNKYVIKASERTREEGRVVSAQQIMIEVLEQGVL